MAWAISWIRAEYRYWRYRIGLRTVSVQFEGEAHKVRGYRMNESRANEFLRECKRDGLL
jgi:hypothetical protein